MKSVAFILCAFVSVLFLSCEDNLVFTSESKLSSRLQGEWNPIKYTSLYGNAYNNVHTWKFDNGSLFVYENAGGAGVDTASYAIDAKVKNPTLKIEGFKTPLLDSSFGFNVKWTIIQLDNKVLDIVGNPFDGGLVELEFEKK